MTQLHVGRRQKTDDMVIDRFVMAQLTGDVLNPARLAAARTFIRRASLDLTGLPPAEVHGERWARHWLDSARYPQWHASSIPSRSRHRRSSA